MGRCCLVLYRLRARYDLLFQELHRALGWCILSRVVYWLLRGLLIYGSLLFHRGNHSGSWFGRAVALLLLSDELPHVAKGLGLAHLLGRLQGVLVVLQLMLLLLLMLDGPLVVENQLVLGLVLVAR